MPRKAWTDEQRAAFGAKMKAMRDEKAKSFKELEQLDVEKVIEDTFTAEAEGNLNPEPTVPEPVAIDTPAVDNSQTTTELHEMIRANQEVLLALLKERQNPVQAAGPTIGATGRVLGEVERYTVDPDQYLSPVERLAAEPKLRTIAFDFNYELDYEMSVRSYENKAGLNMKEPEFLVRLTRIAIDKDGNQTNKRYIIKNMRFHEDPQAALVIAREQGIPLDTFADEKLLLDEMRYLRVKDWLFDIFWPKGTDRSRVEHTEEVLDGTIVQTFSKPVGEPGGLDFDKIR